MLCTVLRLLSKAVDPIVRMVLSDATDVSVVGTDSGLLGQVVYT